MNKATLDRWKAFRKENSEKLTLILIELIDWERDQAPDVCPRWRSMARDAKEESLKDEHGYLEPTYENFLDTLAHE